MNRYTSNVYTRFEKLEPEFIRQNIKRAKRDKINYPKLHIAPKSGLLNDPNGLVYYKGLYHIFYQVCPNGPFHGMKSWNLVTTKDFINYTDHGIVVQASEDFDNFGIFSGGAIILDNKLCLLYTGNHRDADKEYERKSYQVLATLDDNYNVVEKRIIQKPDFTVHTEHFRDPVGLDNRTLLIGAQDVNLAGQLALVKYPKDNYQGQSTIEFVKNQWNLNGFMYECPNLFELDNNSVVVFSPQGVTTQDKYTFNNIHDVVYSVTDHFDIEIGTWNNEQVTQLDYGFDFYAPQVFKDDNRTLLIGWLGVPDTIYPGDDENGWSQMLTTVRELKLVGGKLHQIPVMEYQTLEQEWKQFDSKVALNSKVFRFKTSAIGNFSIEIGNQENSVRLSREADELHLDRSLMQHQINEQYGTSRYVKVEEQKLEIDIIVDMSAIEVFINNGKYVLTSRFFIDTLTQINTSDCQTNMITYLNGIKMKENNE